MEIQVCNIKKAFLQDYVHSCSKRDYIEELEYQGEKKQINCTLGKAKHKINLPNLRLCKKP